MERRDVFSVDAFADEPLSGIGIPVLPDGSTLTDSQLRAIAAEVGAPGLVTWRDDELQHVARTGHGAPVAAGVAGCIGLGERAGLDPGTHTLTHPDGTASTIELTADRTATVGTEGTVETAAVGAEEVAAALGLPADAVGDVDLPVGRTEGAGGTLLVPVVFLEHLGNISPEPGAIESLLGEHTRLFAFTFDTLVAETDVHARVFEPGAGGERAASGIGAAGCARHLAATNAFDGERDRIRVESGHFCDRPSTLDVTLEDGRVTGRALLALDGTVLVPPAQDDDIVEL